MKAITLSVAKDANNRTNLSSMPVIEPTAESMGSRAKTDSTTDLPPIKNSRRPKLMHASLAALILLAGLGIGKVAYDWWKVGRSFESTDDAFVGGDVTVIAPEVAGFISKVLVEDNQRVHAGDLLIKLDDSDYRAALAKAGAAVAIQEATLVNLKATRHLQEAVVAQAQAEISATDAETVRAQDDRFRYQKLLKTGAVSVQNSQQVDADYKRARAAGEKALAGLTAAQRQLEVVGTQKMQTQAALEQAIAEREMARLNLSYTELHAPIDSIVGNRSARTGAYATAGAQLLSLVPIQGLWIDANFKESQLGRIRPGAPAFVRVDSLPGQILHGHVASLSPATGAQFSVLPPENATGNFTKIVQRVAVRIVLDGESSSLTQLRPGLSVTVKVDCRPTEKAGL